MGFARRLALLAAMLLAPAVARADPAPHRMVIHVDSPTKEVMIEALHNASNVIDYYRARAGSAKIEIVANGRGVTMFVNGMSPVGAEVADYSKRYQNDIAFDACAISLAKTGQALGRKLQVMAQAQLVPSGAVKILELEEQHYGYMKP
jgi:intracellular sulfur oxidation DsrE/DsrF family protein